MLDSGFTKMYNAWGFVQCDHQLGRYYRKLFLLTFGVKLQRPANQEHITIISPHDNVFLPPLKLDNIHISFRLRSELFWNGNAVWLDVESEEIFALREKIGLDKDPYISLHFCIGYFENG